MLEARVIPEAGLGDDARAVLVDDRRELVDAIGGKTRLHQELNLTNVPDPVFGLNPAPKAFPRRTQFSGRSRGILGRFPDDGKGRLVS